MSIESVMLSNHLILCHPLLLLSICPSIRVFSSELALPIRWPKYWSFSFNISPSNEHPGLISFRMDWLDLLAVQETLKSLLQHHNSSFAAKSIINLISILATWWCSCVELSLVLLEESVCYDQYVLLTKLLVFVLLYFVLQRPTLPFTPDILTSYLCIPTPSWWKGHLFLVLALEGLIGLHRTDQIQFLWPQWLRHRLGLLWCSIVCLGNELRSFCHFWDCTQVLHFRLLLTIRATPFLLWDSCPQ